MKRRAVTTATFLAGLFYVLVFLLPPSFGGDADGAGARSACEVRLPGRGAELLYTGLRADHPPCLLSRRLDGSAVGPAEAAIAPSATRRDDYHGVTSAQFVAPDRLYYVGLGWDDKTARICLAEREGATWVPRPRAVLDRGKPGEWDSSGLTWVYVLPPSAPGTPWRMWYVGRQGEVGRVGFARSDDGIVWRKDPRPALEPPAGGSLESVATVLQGGFLRAWVVRTSGSSAGEPRRLAAWVPVSGWTGQAVGEPVDVPLAVSGPASLQDLRVVPSPGGARARVYCTDAGAGGRPEVRACDLAPDGEPVGALETVVSPGRAATPNPLTTWRSSVDDGIAVLGAFAVGLGLISLAQVHGKRVALRQHGWPESTAFFVAVVAMAVCTIIERSGASVGWGKSGYALLFHGLYQPLGAAMFSLLAAYLVSAAYRAFKVRSMEGTLMATAAVLIMLGQVPVGHLLTQWLPEPVQIPTLMAWVLAITNNAVIRAVNFGIFVGALATALRVWLSLDRAFQQVEPR